MAKIMKEDPSHRKILVFNDRQVGYDGEINYSEVDEYIKYYLNHYGVEVKAGKYADTVLDYDDDSNKVLTDRYFAEFYRDGNKLRCTNDGVIIMAEGEDKSCEVMFEMTHLYYKKENSFGRVIDEWVIAEHGCDGVYSLGLKYNGQEKEISISTDKLGNVIVYLNEDKHDIYHYPGRYRKGGKKYYIAVDSVHYTAKEYIETLVKLIDREKNSPEMVELFELVMRDPRFERQFTYYLNDMPKAKDTTYYDGLRKQIEDEYQEKLRALDKDVAQSNLISDLSNQYNGLVPGNVITNKMKKMKL